MYTVSSCGSRRRNASRTHSPPTPLSKNPTGADGDRPFAEHAAIFLVFRIFKPILDSLDYDNYMCAADFDSYAAVQNQVAELYRKPIEWQRKALHNVAMMGLFSSDRSIREYAEKIWDVKPCPVNVSNKHGYGLAANQLTD